MSDQNSIKPIVLSIAANDTAGMAGIAQDIKTLNAFNVHALSAITANTAQNNVEVLGINPVDDQVLTQQLNALEDLPIAAIKIGLVGKASQVKIIANFIKKINCPVVLDPVLKSTSGFNFIDPKTIESFIKNLLPYITLITPNWQEASSLTGIKIVSKTDVESAAKKLLSLGVSQVLITGGDTDDQMICQDYFASKEKNFWLTSNKQNTKNTRGTGCALSSSIAAALAKGYSLYDAVVIGKMAINQGLKNSTSFGEQKGCVAIKNFPKAQYELPVLSKRFDFDINSQSFPECELVNDKKQPLGLYPVVDSADWIEKLLKLGVTTIQLRAKNCAGEALDNEIKRAINIAKKYNARLFINDYWQKAIEFGAYGVHLGQEDLDDADINAIFKAGLRLGISTHCHYEVARAIQYKPSYIACGPVYHTNTKQMPWVPHGIQGLQYWRDVLDYPLVAIGGINQERFKKVLATGVDSIAMITAITEAEDYQSVTEGFLGYW